MSLNTLVDLTWHGTTYKTNVCSKSKYFEFPLKDAFAKEIIWEY